MSKDRILWICNHVTLMDVECKLLIKLGYEVFVPKFFGDNRSSAISYDYDGSLSIPKDVLASLNQFDFYHQTWTEEISKIANKYFSIAICVNVYPALFNLVNSFSNKIILRAFGYESTVNYEQTTRETKKIWGFRHLFKPKEIIYDNEMMRKLYIIRDRFYLGAAFHQIISNETPFFKKRSLFLPCGIPQSVWNAENTWTGGGDKIMFVCPSIENPYYNKVYKLFKSEMSDLPHIIFGAQTKEYPDDKAVVGYLNRSDFVNYMQTLPVMFYQSQEPRHLHYHPIEAIIYGMPLVFMSGGILEDYGGSEQPGLCNTYAEAHEKLNLILNGDKKLITDILSHQKKILEAFRDDFILKSWQENFLPLFKENN